MILIVKWVGQKGPPPPGSQAHKIYVGSNRVKSEFALVLMCHGGFVLKRHYFRFYLIPLEDEVSNIGLLFFKRDLKWIQLSVKTQPTSNFYQIHRGRSRAFRGRVPSIKIFRFS